MKSYTFEVIQRDILQNKLYDIFSKSVFDRDVPKYDDFVKENEDCRLDLVSLRLYGTTEYVEELMVANNIINPFSISFGDPITYVSVEYLNYLRGVDKPNYNSMKVAKPKNKKSTRQDANRNKGVPPTRRPLDFQQMIIDRKNRTIKLNTKLQ
jgi:hypothetical protein